MSFLGLGGGSSGPVNQAKLEAAEAELDLVTDMFNRLVTSCYSKCITPRYGEADLLKGESVCIDRCVAKYFDVNVKIGESLQKMGAQNMGGQPGLH